MMKTVSGIETSNDSEDHVLALEGITIMLNNGFKESETLFGKHKNKSALMSAGSSFVSFMQGLMTFEDEKLEAAIRSLKSTQKLCNSMEQDLIDSLKSKFRKKSSSQKTVSVEDVLQRKIIIADCYLYIALVHFIKQEVTGYIKGGWNLRKAWKLYEKCHQQVLALLKTHNIEYNHSSAEVGFVNDSCEANGNVSQENLPACSSMSSLASLDSNEGILSANPSADVHNSNEDALSAQTTPLKASRKTSLILRLYGAVCFGYGAFNLCVSLVPPHLLRIVNLMGFCGDRFTGLECLKISCQSEDMKAPLAMLALLWYHTVVRPFFAVDGNSADAGLPEAEKLLRSNEKKYPTSSLVLFFKGRVLRCKRDIKGALDALQSSYDRAVGLRELQLLCAYEIGWCCMMELQWERALENISRLAKESKWSVCYYTYLKALLEGALKNFEACAATMKEVPKFFKRKDNQLEIYVVRKAKIFQKVPPTHEHIMSLILEVLYLWSALPNCAEDSLQKMLEVCHSISNPCLNGAKHLLLGALYKNLKNEAQAVECFRLAAKLSERDLEDGHFAPYALYELATFMLASPDGKKKGLELLFQCKDDFAGYDFENRLRIRIHATEQRLKEEHFDIR